MANLTLAIDDDLLRRARIRALAQGTSVNALLRDYLVAYAGGRAVQQTALDTFFALTDRAGGERGDATWTRDDLHDRSRLR